jgi:uncharacterized protein (TIGR03435 family)
MPKVLLAVLWGATAVGQGPPVPSTFEVAAIKRSRAADDQSRFETNPGMLRLTNQTLRGCIRAAYAGGGVPMRDYQVIGGPKWMDSDRYDIVAKADGRATALELVRMLQTLLTERFKLFVHRESQLFPGYVLLVAKGGLKIRPEPVEGDPPRAIPSRGNLTSHRVPLAWLPRLLSNIVGAPVLDDTKVTSLYTFKLEWNPAEFEPGPGAVGQGEVVSTALTTEDIAPPSLFIALEQQLGLRLEPRKVPLDVIAVDRAERPSEVD